MNKSKQIKQLEQKLTELFGKKLIRNIKEPARENIEDIMITVWYLKTALNILYLWAVNIILND